MRKNETVEPAFEFPHEEKARTAEILVEGGPDIDIPAGKMTNTQQHEAICRELNELFDRKNKDYGDSFHITFKEEGFAMSRIRLTDKLERFKKLTRSDGPPQVTDESIRDTLLDLANYSIMSVMELDRWVRAEE